MVKIVRWKWAEREGDDEEITGEIDTGREDDYSSKEMNTNKDENNTRETDRESISESDEELWIWTTGNWHRDFRWRWWKIYEDNEWHGKRENTDEEETQDDQTDSEFDYESSSHDVEDSEEISIRDFHQLS